MNYKIILLSAFFALSTLFISAQNFEGIVTINMYVAEKNDNVTIVWKIKGDKHRLEYEGTMGERKYNQVMLIDNKEPKMKLLVESKGEKKVYTSNVPPSSFDNTRYVEHSFESNVRMIESYKADQLTLKSPERRTVCWMSKEVPLSIDILPKNLRANGAFSYFQLRKITGFPLEIEIIGADGKVLVSQKIISIKATPISDDEFVVGSEYMDPAAIMKEGQQ